MRLASSISTCALSCDQASKVLLRSDAYSFIRHDENNRLFFVHTKEGRSVLSYSTFTRFPRYEASRSLLRDRKDELKERMCLEAKQIFSSVIKSDIRIPWLSDLFSERCDNGLMIMKPTSTWYFSAKVSRCHRMPYTSTYFSLSGMGHPCTTIASKSEACTVCVDDDTDQTEALAMSYLD